MKVAVSSLGKVLTEALDKRFGRAAYFLIVGPNALDVLKNTDINLYQGISGSVYDNIEAMKQKKLVQITGSGPAHAGMGR